MPATDTFDPVFPEHLTGEITEPMRILDPDGTPNRVLPYGQVWHAEIEWYLEEATADADVDALRGTWLVRLELESLGKGFEGPVAETTINYTDVDAASTGSRKVWRVMLDADPPPPPDDDPEREVIYRPVALVSFRNELGNPSGMSGSTEGPRISFIHPEVD